MMHGNCVFQLRNTATGGVSVSFDSVVPLPSQHQKTGHSPTTGKEKGSFVTKPHPLASEYGISFLMPKTRI